MNTVCSLVHLFRADIWKWPKTWGLLESMKGSTWGKFIPVVSITIRLPKILSSMRPKVGRVMLSNIHHSPLRPKTITTVYVIVLWNYCQRYYPIWSLGTVLKLGFWIYPLSSIVIILISIIISMTNWRVKKMLSCSIKMSPFLPQLRISRNPRIMVLTYKIVNLSYWE